VAAGLTIAGVVGGFAAWGADRPGPDEAASLLAAGLSSLDLSAVPLTEADGDADQELAAVVEGMGQRRPAVRVQSTREVEDSDAAAAVLELTWDLDDTDQDWTYTTTAPLTYQEDGEDGWRVEWSPALVEPSLVAGERLVVRQLPAERGDVLGARGEVLVTDRPVVRVGIDKTQVAPEEAAGSARRLAEQLPGVDAAEFADRVGAAGPRAFVEAIVLRDDGASGVDRAGIAAIPGGALIDDDLPLAPTREFARPILGAVGEATAELIAESDGRLQAGDVAGLSGLQQTYDEQLRGRPGNLVRAVPAEGTTGGGRELFRRDATPGVALTTTLDVDLQLRAEGLLAPIDSASALVAVRPSTGDVLVAASGPGGRGYSTATVARHAPGSTFKVVTSLALLRAGMTQESILSCTPTVTVDGRSFKNYDDYPEDQLGDVTLRTAIANSCNTALISARDQAPQTALSEAAAALGLGPEHDLGVPSFGGSVPVEAGETEHAASMIGQGRVEASPLAMAVVAASIARGETVTPRLLQHSAANDVPSDQAVTALEAAQLREMLRAVVTEGSAGFLDDVPGDEVAAKTGTAEYGTEQPPRTHGWMIGIQGDLAVAVFVEDGVSGARAAGPVLDAFLGGTS
jgi:cell division protein FtsI/penicillin-binding protein 2